MLDRTTTRFSHVKAGDTEYVSGGLRDFFLYRDLGVAQATHGKVIAHLVKANMAPEQGTGWHRHEADFQIVIYPGPLGVPQGNIPADAPPAFFLVANDDSGHVGPVLSQLEKYRQANRPVEVHLYAHGGHGFNMGHRSKLASIKGWPQRMTD